MSKDSRNTKTESNICLYWSCRNYRYRVNYLVNLVSRRILNAVIVVSLTTVGTAPGFCTLRALTTWNTSTTPSVLHLSMVVVMAQNIPLRVTVSLQWTTMGLLPDLIWTLVISSITSVILFRLEQWPSGSQQVIWNWVTWCACWVCTNTLVMVVNIRNLQVTNLSIKDTEISNGEPLQWFFSQQFNGVLPILIYSTARPVLCAGLLPSLHQTWHHHHHSTLTIKDHLPEVPCSWVHWTLCYDECLVLFVTLQGIQSSRHTWTCGMFSHTLMLTAWM